MKFSKLRTLLLIVICSSSQTILAGLGWAQVQNLPKPLPQSSSSGSRSGTRENLE